MPNIYCYYKQYHSVVNEIELFGLNKFNSKRKDRAWHVMQNRSSCIICMNS